MTRTDGKAITYRYDASGNRASKLLEAVSGAGVRTHYVRDATGIILAVYESRLAAGTTLPNPSLVEQPLYGSSRLGGSIALIKPTACLSIQN